MSYSTTTNRITSAGFSYDANGNLTGDGIHTYTWDAEGRLASLDGTSNSETYDAGDRRVEQIKSGTYTEVLYAPNGAKLALMNGQTVTKMFVALPGGATAVYAGTSLSYYRHPDWLGSSRIASTTSRTVYYDGDYAPFGESYNESGTTDRSFTGQNQDLGATDLYDFLYREHSAIEGRWISPDPAGLAVVDPSLPQSWNRYAYVMGDPVNHYDPSGLETYCIPLSLIGGGKDFCYETTPFVVTTTATADSKSGGTNPATDQIYNASNPGRAPDSPYNPSMGGGGGGNGTSAVAGDKPIDLKKVGSCLADSTLNHYGLTAAALASGALAIPISKSLVPPFRMIGTPTTNLLSVLGHYVEINVPGITIDGLASTNLFRIAGRANPYVAWALLAVDAGMISYDTYQCYQKTE